MGGWSNQRSAELLVWVRGHNCLFEFCFVVGGCELDFYFNSVQMIHTSLAAALSAYVLYFVSAEKKGVEVSESHHIS